MSSRAVRCAAFACALILTLHAPGHAQSAGSSADERARLAARIDSLLVEKARNDRLLHERDSVRSAAAQALRADTTVVGPFLFVNRAPPPDAAVAALRSAWAARAPLVGAAVSRLDGMVISLNLSPRELPASTEVHQYWVRVRHGVPQYAEGAEHAVGAALVAAMPDDVRQWIGNGSIHSPDAYVWAYRDLATNASVPARRCYARDLNACAVAVAGDGAALLHVATRVSLLRHAFELGGAGAYERLLRDAPDVGARLSHAAERPLENLLTDWRAAVEAARPRIHAGVARAGMWTLLWLAALGLLSMRSTRWRLG